MKAFERVPGRSISGSQPHRCVGDVRLHRRAGTRACAEGMRRQSHARERHEAGRQHQGPRTRRPVAGHQGQHLGDRLRADLAGPTASGSRAKPGSASARSSAATSAASLVSKPNNRIRPPATPSRGAFFVSLLLSPDRKSRLASQTAYTSADHALGIGLAPPQEAAAPIPVGRGRTRSFAKCPC